MLEFIYEGTDASGKKLRGLIEAESREGALISLRKKGVIITSIRQKPKREPAFAPGFGGISVGRLAVYTRKFAQLTKTDIPISEIFNILAEEEENPLLAEASQYVGKKVAVGEDIGEAMAAKPRVFGKLYIRMIQAGINSGTLDLVADNLAKMYESENALRKKLWSRLTYPFILLFVCFVISILLKFLGFIPAHVFVQIMIFWMIIAGLGVIGMTRPGYAVYRQIGFKLPAIGALMRNINLARFCRIFGLQYAAGVPVLEGLDVAREVLQDPALSSAVKRMQKQINDGMELRDAMVDAGVFPRRVVSMVGVGERGGGVDLMLEKLAEYYELDIDTQSTVLTTVLYFVVFLAVAVTVGIVVINFWTGYWRLLFEAAGM